MAMQSTDGLISDVLQNYKPPGSSVSDPALPKHVEWVRNVDGSTLVDHNQKPISVDRLLASKPLRSELSTRPGPGNKKLTYLSGEGVTRTLNEIFGYDGWNLEIKETKREQCTKDDKDRYHVAYTATVRLTHRVSGAYKEDVGAGDSIDRSMGTAVAHALKASITDAMKRSARHFGDKLGNCLYGNFSHAKAPTSLKMSLDQYDIDRANSKFGFRKDASTTSTPKATRSTPTHHSTKSIAEPSSSTGSCTSAQKTTAAGTYNAPTHHARNNLDPPATSSTSQTRPMPPPTSHQSHPIHTTQEARNSGTAATLSSNPTLGVMNPQFKQQQSQQYQPSQQYQNMSHMQQTPKGIAPALLPSVTPTNTNTVAPPPTPGQRLQASHLFGGGLSQFAAGTTATPQHQGAPDENWAPPARPGTSTGPSSQPKQQQQVGPFAGRKPGDNKRPGGTLAHNITKKPSMGKNPYSSN